MSIRFPPLLFRAAFAATVVLAAGAAFAADAGGPVAYKIDPHHTQVLYSYTHMGYSHITGRFDRIEGDFLFDANDPTRSSIEVNIPIDSIDTGVKDLDDDMKSANFFDVARFPLASFQSRTVTRADADKLAMAGDLTIHGITRPVTFEVTINKVGARPGGTPHAGFDATATVKRSDFGMSGLVPYVGDEVTIHITMEAGVPKPQP